MIFPINRLAIMPHTSSALLIKTKGPGWILNCWKAANMIAAVAEVGKPKVNKGTKTPAAAPLFAASGPATPSIAPDSKSSGFLLNFFSSP